MGICKNCGQTFGNSEKQCPYCDYVVKTRKVVDRKMPSTIKELEEWYYIKDLPPCRVTRFYIGKNLKRKRVFGIYKGENTGNYIVYKNKDNGERSVRYEGPSEKVAVREFYLRLKQEINLQKERAKKHKGSIKTGIKNELKQLWAIPIGLLFILFIASTYTVSGEGYYQYNENYYYYIGSWYQYEDGSWNKINDSNIITILEENRKDYFVSKEYNSDYNIGEFPRKSYERDYYNDTSTSDGWDSSSSWDSSYTNWGSDW